MSDSKIYPIKDSFSANAHISESQYTEMYNRSITDPKGFWSEQAEDFIDWFKPWDNVLEWDYLWRKLWLGRKSWSRSGMHYQ